MKLVELANWLLFYVRNLGRKPPYPFEDDFRDTPLELQIGPWGKTLWRDKWFQDPGAVYDITKVDDVKLVAESLERDIYGWTAQECRDNKQRCEAENQARSGCFRIQFGKPNETLEPRRGSCSFCE